MNDDNKKELGYRANIKYDDDYFTDYTHHKQSNTQSPSGEQDEDNVDFMEMIQGDINSLIHLVPNLPINLQTAVNQVLKPVIRDWKKIKDHEYPNRIPDGEDPVIPGPIPPTPGPEPGPSDKDPDDEDIEFEDPWYPDPDPEPDHWELPDPKPPQWDPYEPEEFGETEFPVIITPDIIDPTPSPRSQITQPTVLVSPLITDDDLFRPATDRKVIYEEIDEVEKMKMEYTKNLADVIHHYTSNLKDLLCDYFSYKIAAITSAADDYDLSFLINEITSDNCSTSEELRHLMDAALRNEVIGSNKIHFCLNTFSLESTLYHVKNFNAVQELRLRYAEIDKLENNEIVDSTSNKILNGCRDMYDKKYDLAYINLYKYLNGSLVILEDCLRAEEASLKSKETLIRKGGINK